MGFEDLPTFPQGGVARSESGNQGIPPEAFQQALVDTGVRLIADSKRPEDSPAIQAALGAEVDTLLGQIPGHGQPPGPAYEAPAGSPPTDTAPQSPASLGPVSPDRIRQILEKYSGDPGELAKAYAHTDAARTRAQQDRAMELTALRSTVENLQQEIAGLRNVAENIGSDLDDAPGDETASLGGSPEQAEAFFKNPVPILENVVSKVVRDHLLAYTDAQSRINQEQSFEEYRQAKDPEVEQMRPFMEEVYMEDRDLFEALEPRRSLDLLLRRSHERQEALRGRLFFEEMRTLTGGGPQMAAAPATPGTTGALPSSGTGMGRVINNSPAPAGNWSNTRNMDSLWKSRSDGVEEMSALTRVLKERGFGEDIPI